MKPAAGDEPIWTDAECNRYIAKFFFNGLWLGFCAGVIVGISALAAK